MKNLFLGVALTILFVGVSGTAIVHTPPPVGGPSIVHTPPPVK